MTKVGVTGEVEFAAIDFESTGSSLEESSPIQIGLALMRGRTLMPNTFFRSYLQASRHTFRSAHVARRSDSAQLLRAPSLLSLWPVIRKHLQGRRVVAHSIASEKRYLRIFPFHGFGPWIDTLKLARALYPGLNDYSLGNLVIRLKIEEEMTQLCYGLKWHDALYDAVASLLLLRTLMETCQHSVEEYNSSNNGVMCPDF